jgi:hypothetical protein
VIVSWKKSQGFLLADTTEIPCWCRVRNDLNGYRPIKGRQDVFRTTNIDGSPGVPSMPRVFPNGDWRIFGINPHPDRVQDKYLYPFYIATDANQPLDEWELDGQGFYLRKTPFRVNDYAYGLHFSCGEWTQGCIRIANIEDLLFLVSIIRPELDAGRTVAFSVTD